MDFIAQSTPWTGIPVGEHLMLVSPMIALVCTMLGVVACPIILGRSTRTIAGVGTLGILVTFILLLRVASRLAEGGGVGIFPVTGASGMLIVDNLSVAFQVILVVFLAAVVWLWWMGSAETERNAPEFFVLLLGSALGMALMVSTANLLMIVIAIELASLPSYAIVGFDKRDRVGAEASLKYMIFGAVSAAIMIYGVSLLYGLVGSLNVADVATYVSGNLVVGESRLLLGAALLSFFAGIAFKISAVPFHFWCPDAFQGAKIEVTTWLSVASKAAGLILLGRLVVVFCSAVGRQVEVSSLIAPLAWVIGIMAAATCTLGNFAAYKQTSVKRLLAYSSIAHAGYMMMAAAVFIHPTLAGYQSGLTAMLTYIVIYLFMNLGAFGVTAMVVWDGGSDHVDAFNGLMRRTPWLAIPMVCCLMSLVGMPPFAGFLGKWWVLVALGGMQTASPGDGWFSLSWLGWFLIITASVNTLIGLYYYMRIVVRMTMRDDGQSPVRAPLGGVAIVNACAVILLVLTLAAQPLKRSAQRLTADLFRPSPTKTVEAGNDEAVAAVDGVKQ